MKKAIALVALITAVPVMAEDDPPVATFQTAKDRKAVAQCIGYNLSLRIRQTITDIWIYDLEAMSTVSYGTSPTNYLIRVHIRPDGSITAWANQGQWPRYSDDIEHCI